VIGLAVLRRALQESDHSDGKLLAFGLAARARRLLRRHARSFEPVE